MHVLALLSSLHQNFAGNQQTYLAVLLDRQGGPETVLLVNQFRAAGDPIRPQLLREKARFGMTLTRQGNCDRPTASVSGMLSLQATYDEAGVEGLEQHAPATLPCYQVDHERTRVQR